MAKDDYQVLVYKILLYLYAVFKNKIVFNSQELKLALKVDGISDDYLFKVLDMMQQDELITGLEFIKAWGGDPLLINDLSDMRITSKGITHLTENSSMQKVKNYIIENVDFFASLIAMIIK